MTEAPPWNGPENVFKPVLSARTTLALDLSVVHEHVAFSHVVREGYKHLTRVQRSAIFTTLAQRPPANTQMKNSPILINK